MIDFQFDTPVPFAEIPDWCEANLGWRINRSTAHRWRKRGVRGVKLETCLLGGRRCTSDQALQRFFADTTTAADGVDCSIELGRRNVDADSYLNAEGF